MRAAILWLILSSAAQAADYNLERAARMMVDWENCQVNYDAATFRKAIVDGSIRTGKTMDAGMRDVAVLVVELKQKIESTVGFANYCPTRR